MPRKAKGPSGRTGKKDTAPDAIPRMPRTDMRFNMDHPSAKYWAEDRRRPAIPPKVMLERVEQRDTSTPNTADPISSTLPQVELRIPPLNEDVIYAILEHLQGTKWALWRCSLVCRAWLAPARYYLFRRIIVRGTLCKDDMPYFMEFFDSSSYARNYMHALTLNADIYLNNPRVVVNLGILHTIIKTTPHFRSLTINNVALNRDLAHDGPTPEGGPISPRLDFLHFRVGWRHIEKQYFGFLDLLCSCASIGILFLHGITTHNPISPDVADRLQVFADHVNKGVFPPIEQFIYHLSTELLSMLPLYEKIGQVARTSGALKRISYRGLKCMNPDSLRDRITEFYDTIIAGARDSLVELEFYSGPRVYREGTAPPEIWDKPDLSGHHKLERLTLALECELMPWCAKELIWALTSHTYILRTFTPPSLKVITFKVGVPYNRDAEPYQDRYLKYLRSPAYELHWANFDAALAELPGSPQVILDFVGHWETMGDKDELKKCMDGLLPRLRRENRLSLAYCRTWQGCF
ncbi:hypothetical protein C8Q77DRAFT_1157688 [Trametes polyzona]|nr:hypothetical protein C8Q77DRAFT_1157688 [Trametes polyzona]